MLESMPGIPDANSVPLVASERTDQIAGILWQASMGAMPESEARESINKTLAKMGIPEKDRNKIFDSWMVQSMMAMVALGIHRNVQHAQPSEEDMRQVATRIKESSAELFVRKSQFPGDTIIRYKGVIEAIGGRLRIYQNVEDLETMIKNPAKSIVMIVDSKDKDTEFLGALKAKAPELRLMNFAKMDGLDKMETDELDNYQAEILGILLIARSITPEDFQDKGSSTYRLLAHLLEDYIPEGLTVEDYIEGIVTNAARLIKTILRALPITAYKVMRQAVSVLWSA